MSETYINMLPRGAIRKRVNDFLHQREILKQLRQACASGETSLVIDFERILEFNLELARDLLYNPTETLSEANRELEQITKIPGMRLEVRGLDKTLTVDDLRAQHIDKFIEVRGTVTMVGFNKLIRVEGYGETKEFEDFQRVLVDDCLNVILKGDLVGSVGEGDRVTITGTLGAINEGNVYGYGLVANHIEREGAGGTTGKLGLSLCLVQTEMEGTRHYKDGEGNRLILYPDGSFSIEEAKR